MGAEPTTKATKAGAFGSVDAALPRPTLARRARTRRRPRPRSRRLSGMGALRSQDDEADGLREVALAGPRERAVPEIMRLQGRQARERAACGEGPGWGFRGALPRQWADSIMRACPGTPPLL